MPVSRLGLFIRLCLNKGERKLDRARFASRCYWLYQTGMFLLLEIVIHITTLEVNQRSSITRSSSNVGSSVYAGTGNVSFKNQYKSNIAKYYFFLGVCNCIHVLRFLDDSQNEKS